MTPLDRWNELQDRWASGETLSPEEECERLDLAAGDPLARRELELFAELRERVDRDDHPLSREIFENVLAAVRRRPKLRVIDRDGSEPAPPPPRTGRRWATLGAALAACTALAGAFFAYPLLRSDEPLPAPSAAAPVTPARAELVLSSGEVEVTGRSVAIGARPLDEGDRVVTREGRACLTIDPAIDVCLGAHGAARVESLDASRIAVRVEAGTVLATLAPREGRRSFALLAGDVVATAHGTVFAVERGSDGAVEVVVVEGSVEVARGASFATSVSEHSRVRLHGSSTSVERGAVGRSEEAKLLALGAPRGLWASPNVGVLEVRGREAGLEVAIDDQAPLRLPLHAFVPAGKRRIAVRSAGGTETVSTVDVAAGETRRLVVPETEAPAEPAQTSAAAPSAAALLGAARRELGAGRTDAALALYRRLRASYPSSPEAKTVLVTMGKLELDRQQPARALVHFDAYLASGGPLSQEALAGKIGALRALGKSGEEKQAIELYLQRHPGGFQAPALRKRLESLSR